MNATLNFNLPEDQSDFELASHAGQWHDVVWDLDQFLRSKTKHGNEYKTADEALEAIRKELHDKLAENNLEFA